MKYISKLAGITLISVSIVGHAGVYATTAHSRANCINNESITWFLWHSYDWHVISFHNYDYNNPSKGYHYVDTGLTHTWRAAAVHWNESELWMKFLVSGFHYYLDRGHEILDVNTVVTDCSIYDGWWDH